MLRRLLQSRLFAPSPSRGAMLSVPFLSIAVALLNAHVTTIRDVKQAGLPAAVTLPALERRLNILQEQVDVSELEKAVAQGSEEEIIATYILPDAPQLDRVLGFIDLLRARLEETKMLRGMSAIEPGAAETLSSPGGVRAHPFTFEADVTEEGMRIVLNAVRLSGLLTISDVLTDEERRRLLQMTEDEDPTSIAVMEHFLSTSILPYAREPKPFEEQVFRSFTSPAFQRSFTELLRHSGLTAMQSIYGGGLGQALSQQKLWPLRFVTLERMAIRGLSDGWFHASFTIRAYSRTGS